MMHREEESEQALKEYLKKSGILDAYEALLLKLLANGPPRKQNIFAYAADQILAWQTANLTGGEDDKIMRVSGKKQFNGVGGDTNDFVNNSVNGSSSVHNKALDKLKGAPAKPPKYDSDSDNDYDFKRSSSIVRVPQPDKSKEKRSTLSINTAVHSDDEARSTPSTPSSAASSTTPRTPQTPNAPSTPPSSILQRAGSTSSNKGASVTIVDHPTTNGNGYALPRSNSAKSVGSINSHSSSPRAVPSFTSALPRSESAKSIGSNYSNSPSATPRGVDTSLSRSESARSVGSNYSSGSAATPRGVGLVLPKSDSYGSIHSNEPSPVATPRGSQSSAPFPRSESAKSIDSPRGVNMARSGSGKSMGTIAPPPPSSPALPRSGSARSVGSNESSPIMSRSNSAKSVESNGITPRSAQPPPVIPSSDSLKSISSSRSSSTKSVNGSIPITKPAATASKNRPFLFTITTDDTPDSHTLLHETTIPSSPSAPLSKNPSLASINSSVPSTPTAVLSPASSFSVPKDSTVSSSNRRPLPLGSLAQQPQEFAVKPQRRGSIFSEKDLPQPDLGAINSQLENMYGSEASESEEVEEDEEIEDDDSPIDSDEEAYRDDFEEDAPAMNFLQKDKGGLRRSSIFEEIANIKPPIQFDEGIEDSYNIVDEPNESILSNDTASDNTGEFEFEDIDESETLEVFEDGEENEGEEEAEEFEEDSAEQDDEELVDEFLRGMERRKEPEPAMKSPGPESARKDIRIDLSKVYGGGVEKDESPKESGTNSSTAREGISESARGLETMESWRSGAESDRPPLKDVPKGRRRSFTIPYETLDYSPAASPKGSHLAPLPIVRKKTPRSPHPYASDGNVEEDAGNQQLSAAPSYDSYADELSSDEPLEGSSEGNLSRNPSSDSAGRWNDPNKSDSDEEMEYHSSRRGGVRLSDEEDAGLYEDDMMDRDLDELDYMEFKKPPKQRMARTIEDEDEFGSD